MGLHSVGNLSNINVVAELIDRLVVKGSVWAVVNYSRLGTKYLPGEWYTAQPASFGLYFT